MTLVPLCVHYMNVTLVPEIASYSSDITSYSYKATGLAGMTMATSFQGILTQVKVGAPKVVEIGGPVVQE